ncbi:MAG: AAA family ATPase [Bacteroidota bacterium]
MPPEAIIIAGPNGAGKSTLAYEYLALHGFVYLSADLIAAEINPDQPAAARIEAGKRFLERLSRLIGERQSLIVETTLAGRGFLRFAEQLQRAGYSTRIAFVFLDTPELCIRRVRERVQKGGHAVPEADIVRRFYRSQCNFWRLYRHAVDRWYLFFNAGENFQEVAVGEQDRYRVTDERLFELFLHTQSGEARHSEDG